LNGVEEGETVPVLTFVKVALNTMKKSMENRQCQWLLETVYMETTVAAFELFSDSTSSFLNPLNQ
jgi:hypothetical protein